MEHWIVMCHVGFLMLKVDGKSHFCSFFSRHSVCTGEKNILLFFCVCFYDEMSFLMAYEFPRKKTSTKKCDIDCL